MVKDKANAMLMGLVAPAVATGAEVIAADLVRVSNGVSGGTSTFGVTISGAGGAGAPGTAALAGKGGAGKLLGADGRRRRGAH